MPSYLNNPTLQSFLESQVSMTAALTRKTYDAVRQLSELNLHFSQQLIDDGVRAGRQMLATSDPVQMGAAALAQLQPIGAHLRTYQQQLMQVLSGVQIDLNHFAETHLPETSRTASAAAEELARRGAELTAAWNRPYRGDGSGPVSNGADGAHHTSH